MIPSTAEILIVDDEERNCRLLEALLRPEGYVTRRAAGGREALASVAEDPPDLILLDLRMPGMDGGQVASALKADPATRSIPIIMVTAQADREARLAALDAGTEDFLTKPVDRAELVLRVRNLLRLKELNDFLAHHRAVLEAEVQARTAELQRFRTAMDSTGDAIFLIDRDTMRYVEVNSTASEMLGYSHEELLQMGPLDLQPQSATLTARLRGIAGYGTTRLTETVRRKNGSFLTVEATRHLERFGEDWIIVSVLRDITEREKAYKRLVEAERLAHLGGWEWDIVGDTITWSEELYLIFGYEPAEFEPSYDGFLAHLHPQDRPVIDEAVRRCLATCEPLSYVVQIVAGDAELRWIEVQGKAEATADGAVLKMIGTVLDVTERKNAEGALAALNADLERQVQERTAEAERANEAKSEFLSRMSHELRTPLNAMLGFAQLLGMDDLNADQAASVEHIMSGGHHLLGLINEVLDLACIESGHLAISLEPVALSAVLDDALALVRPQAAATSVSLPTHVPAGADVHVVADQQRLRQIILNLLSNAVKYNSEAGTVSLSCERREDGRLRLGFTDTGAGVAAEDVERIFSPFQRLGAAATAIEGTGLGLAVSKRLADAMGAEIGLSSVPGQGSTFWVDLTVADSQATPSEMPVLERWELRPGAKPATVLYIEDNPSNLQLVAALLNRRPHVRLLTANSGHMGLEAAREGSPDLVLLDLDLPDISGAEVLSRLRSNVPTEMIPVVVVSADATESQVRRLLAAGATAYLTKPLDVDLFFTVVDEALQATPV